MGFRQAIRDHSPQVFQMSFYFFYTNFDVSEDATKILIQSVKHSLLTHKTRRMQSVKKTLDMIKWFYRWVNVSTTHKKWLHELQKQSFADVIRNFIGVLKNFTNFTGN